jgi:sensor histidine kinase YesM
MNFFDNIIRFHKDHRIVTHIVFWLMVLVVLLSATDYYERSDFNFYTALVDEGMILIAQILASYFLSYLVIPKFFYTKRYLLLVFVFILGSYFICVLSRYLTVNITEPLVGKPPNSSETIIEILTNIPKLAYVYFFRIFSVAFVFIFLKLLKDQNDIQKRALVLEKQKSETELKLLKTQLNPHFLFNTLNNIYSLSVSQSPATSSSIARLSGILDHILYRCNADYVLLTSEIDLLKNYIELEKLRYDDRLKVNFKTSVDHDIEIAPLILLSLVENAFKHGAAEEMGNLVIDIDLEVMQSALKFNVVNTFTNGSNNTYSHKIGLRNLKRQLDIIYPKKHNLDTSQANGLFNVTLTVELKS